jgi:hypothetical protein
MRTYNPRELPSQARLRELFDYRDGELHRRDKSTPAYWGGRVDGVLYNARRLIWQWHYGNLSTGVKVTSVNNNGLDNRIENLRLATKAEVSRSSGIKKNNACGCKGVFFHSQLRKWCAKISVNYRHIQLGLFDTKEEARDAYCAAAEKYHGEFANFGTPRQYIQPPQKDTPPSSGQMTGRATGTDSQETGSHESNHGIALTDNKPAVQAPERVAHRQTQAAEDVTGLRFCKRCATHRKSFGGLTLTDALNRQYWICKPCCASYQTQRGSRPPAGIASNGGRAQA